MNNKMFYYQLHPIPTAPTVVIFLAWDGSCKMM